MKPVLSPITRIVLTYLRSIDLGPPIRAQAISDGAGCHINTVTRTLRRLEKAGVIEPVTYTRAGLLIRFVE